MEPRIQYARTQDGVSIAYSTLGEGSPPLILVPVTPFSHVYEEWRRLPERRRWYERLAADRMIVVYDARGCGLSDRTAEDFSLQAQLMDLDAVVQRLGLEMFSLWGAFQTSPVAISYAIEHPAAVSRLILWSGYASARHVYERGGRIQALRTLREVATDWEMYTETLAHTQAGWSGGDFARRLAAQMRESVSQESAFAALAQMSEFDVTDDLSRLRMPTLVIHRRGASWPELSDSQRLASEIPNARLHVMDGGAVPSGFEEDDGVDEMTAFLRESEPERQPRVAGGDLTVILFADIADSTALTERLGDAAFRERARELDSSLREIIRAQQGTPVEGKLLGDGVLAVFTSARQAVQAALRCGDAGASSELALHLGIHAGDVIREGDNVFGGAVNMAARVADASAPGEVLVSQTVRDLARTSAGVQFDDRGEHALKGIVEPQRLFAVRERA